MEILVFKTSIEHISEINPITTMLDALGSWKFDMEDCDKIFRIETNVCKGKIIEQLFKQCSIECQEL